MKQKYIFFNLCFLFFTLPSQATFWETCNWQIVDIPAAAVLVAGIYCKKLTIPTDQKNLIKAGGVCVALELVYLCRGTRTDDKGQWKINGQTMSDKERKENLSWNPLAHNSHWNYWVDTRFGTFSDWKTVTTTEEKTNDQGNKIIITKEEKVCKSTGSGPMAWVHDNVLRHVGTVTTNTFVPFATIASGIKNAQTVSDILAND